MKTFMPKIRESGKSGEDMTDNGHDVDDIKQGGKEACIFKHNVL